MANPFLFTEEPVGSQSTGRGFNPFLSEGETDNPFANNACSSSATNPFAFLQDSSQPTEPEFNYEDIFSSHVPTATSDIFASDASQPPTENLFSPIAPDANVEDKAPPRRPPPPAMPGPPKETKDLILSVTGAMEATSSHLLDRLQATRTPSPTPMRELHSPSPTQFGDLLDVDGGSSVTEQPLVETHQEVNLLGDDFDFTPAQVPQKEMPLVGETQASLVSPPKPVAPAPEQLRSETVEPVAPVAIPAPVAAPMRPAPPRVPERPKPPVQPPRPAPPQRIPTPEQPPLDLNAEEKPVEPTPTGVFESAFANMTQTKQPATDDIFSPPAAPPPTATFPPAQIKTPSPVNPPPQPATTNDFDLVFTQAQPSAQLVDPFASQPSAAPADDFDAFSAKFDSFGTSEKSSVDPFGAAAAPSDGAAFDPFGSTFGPTPATGVDDNKGFGGDDGFDAFLSMREPPPVPQGTPARVSRGESVDSNDGNEFNIFIKPKSSESAQLDNGPLPTLAPPPKSPSQMNAFQDTSPRFNPFDNTLEPVQTGLENAFAQAMTQEAQPMQRTDSQETPPTPLFDEDISQPLEDFPRVNYTGQGWEMMLRQPNKKKITGQRFWKKVWIKLVYQGENPVLQLSNNKDDKDPFQELPLQPCYSVSEIGAQQFDQYGKIFTVKLQFIFYKERPGVRPGQVTKAERLTNKLSQFAAYAIQGDYQGVKEFGSDLKKLGLPVEHAPQISQLFKIGSQNYEDMKQFSMCVEEALFRLSAHRDRALTYKMEEVQLTVVDELYVEQNANGGVEKQIARVRLFFLGFLSGMPDVELGVNDLVRQGKEVVGRHDIIPVVTEEWIRLEGVEFHTCVQQDVYEKSRTIKFKPPDAMYLELMRFRVRPPRNRELPIQLKCVFIVTGNKVEIRSDMLVPGFTSRKLGQIPCEDVMVRIPIPECWIYQFRVEKHFRYGSVKSAHRRTGKVKGIERFLGAIDNMEPSLMEATSGVAKYEHQHRSIVWRVPRLPKEGQGAYTTHNLVVRLQLTSYDQIPDQLAKYCYLEFTMPATTVSHTTVRSVSITESDSDTPPEKYVRQLSRHEYRVEIEHTQGEGPIDYLAVTATKPPAITEEPKPVAPPPPESDSDSSG